MFYIGISGVILVIVSWLIQNSERFPHINRNLFRKYSHVINAISSMHQRNFVLTNDNEGFPEIVEYLMESITPKDAEITHIKTIVFGSANVNTNDGKVWKTYIDLEVSFSNYPPIKIDKLAELSTNLQKKYRENILFKLNTVVFWLGVILMLLSVVLEFALDKADAVMTSDNTSLE